MGLEFLEVIESIRAEEASVQRLFNSEGQGVRQLAGRQNQQYMTKLAEAAKFVADVFEGRRPVYHLQEAMTTSDFPLLFGDILDRQLLANYRESPATYRSYCKVATVRDFRTVNRYFVNGAEAVLSQVNEQAEYPEVALDEGRYQYSVQKYGRRIPFSWEAMINDDLDALKDVPARFGRAARRTEERFATVLFCDANGPHVTLYAAGNNNIVTGNPALSIAGLQTAMQVLAAQTDTDGEPIVIDSVHLVVPPALEITAQNILNALEIRLNEAGGTANQMVVAQNWMKSRVQLHVNWYIPMIITNGTRGNTSWFLFANPSVGRPALEVGFLRGHTEPEIFIKSPNAQRVGGGAVNPLDGDFDTDSIQYKVRHVLGGTRLDPKATVASRGQ